MTPHDTRPRRAPSAARWALVAAALVLASPLAAAETEEVPLLGPPYPVRAVLSFQAGLFHWLDSLAGLDGPGLSAGKTIPAHREDYVRRFGKPDATARAALQRFAAARVRLLQTQAERVSAGEQVDVLAPLRAMLEARSAEDARKRLSRLMDPSALADIEAGLDRFREAYRTIWRDGDIPRRFVEAVRSDRRGTKLSEILGKVCAFYGFDRPPEPVPRVVLVPVARGYGTHAMAVGGDLLIELRADDGLAETASVIVHENAHFLFERLSPERRDALEAVLLRHGDAGRHAWNVLREAIPTALGQGVADRHFRPLAWSRRQPWYHRDDVDRYAKAIYPLVRGALASGATLDAAFLERCWAARPDLGTGAPTRR